MNLISKRIKNLRESRDLTQQTLCVMIDMVQQQYSKYENGKSDIPSHILARLAEYYDVSTDYLLGRTDCKEGIAALTAEVTPEITVGAVITDILSLNDDARKQIIEQIGFQKMKGNGRWSLP